MDVESEDSLVASRSCKNTKCCRCFGMIMILLITALGTGFSLLCYDKFSNIEIAMKEVRMIVPAGNWSDCGSTIYNKEMKIEISDDYYGNKCFTESIKYETHNKEEEFVAHDMIVWNTNNLLS